jgi:hypothetical protein
MELRVRSIEIIWQTPLPKWMPPSAANKGIQPGLAILAPSAAEARGKLSFHSLSRRHRRTSGGPLHARGARSRSCREGAFRPVNLPQVGASRKLCRDCCRRVLLLEPFLAFRSSQQTQAARIPMGIYLGCTAIVAIAEDCISYRQCQAAISLTAIHVSSIVVEISPSLIDRDRTCKCLITSTMENRSRPRALLVRCDRTCLCWSR